MEIEIEGESYALDKIPSDSSGVVRAEKEKLLGAIDLKALVIDLGRVGYFIGIAYNGVGAAGYEHTKDQIEIQQLGYDIIELCNKSAWTLEKALSNILTDLQCIYGYLLDNLEEMALEKLSSISKLAGEMEKAALELYHDFVEEEKKVIAILQNIQHSEKIQASKDKKEKRRRIQHIKREQELIKKHQEKQKEAEARRRSIEQQEDKVISEIGAPSFKSLVNIFTTKFGAKVFDGDDGETRAAIFRQNRLNALEVETAIRKKRQEALVNMSAFTAKLRQCNIHNDQEVAECALHEAVGALKHLSTVMMQPALFWKQIQDHCRSLADSQIKANVETFIKYPKEKRLKVWTSSVMKHTAIVFYSGWVALNSVYTVYMEQIKDTQRDLYKYITENPTYEECKRNFLALVEKFMADLKSDQKALEEKDLKAQEEILALAAN